MTTPSDPFSPSPASGGQPYGQPSAGGAGQPAYGQPDATPGYGTPPSGGYGTPPYAGQPYGDPLGSPAGMPPLASWGLRFGGYFIDFLISIALGVVVGLVGFAVGDEQGALANLAGFALFIYFGYLTGTTGQTPGRKAVGIRVLRERDGQVLGAGAGIGRGFLHILDALPLLLGFFWPIWDRKKQTFADKIIKSVVIKV